jgi:hypothetical protein
MAGKVQTADQQKKEGWGCHGLLSRYQWVVRSPEIICCKYKSSKVLVKQLFVAQRAKNPTPIFNLYGPKGYKNTTGI